MQWAGKIILFSGIYGHSEVTIANRFMVDPVIPSVVVGSSDVGHVEGRVHDFAICYKTSYQ